MDQLFDDDESDPFKVLKATENKKKKASGGSVGGPGAKSPAQALAQASSNVAGKQMCKKSQKDCKNPLPLNVGMDDKKRGDAATHSTQERRNKMRWKKTCSTN